MDTRKKRSKEYIDLLIGEISLRNPREIFAQWECLGYRSRIFHLMQNRFCLYWGLLDSNRNCAGLIAPDDKLSIFTHAYDFCDDSGGVRDFCQDFKVLYVEFLYSQIHSGTDKYNVPALKSLSQKDVDALFEHFSEIKDQIKIVDLFDCILQCRKTRKNRTYRTCTIDLYDL